MNDLPGRGDVNPYGIPVRNPHEREGPDETDVPPCPTCGGALRAVERNDVTYFEPAADELVKALERAMESEEWGDDFEAAVVAAVAAYREASGGE